MPPTRKRSALWNHFSELTDNKAKCGYCAQTLSIPNKSIGNLSRHMRLKHPTIQIQLSRQQNTIQQQSSTSILDPVPSMSSFTSLSQNELPATSHISLPLTSHGPPKQSTMTEFIHKPVPVKKINEIDKQIIKIIVKNYHPFSLVEQPEIKELFAMIIPGYSLPTRKTVSNSLLPKMYQECLEKVQVNIDSAWAVCLTTDSWTSINNVSFVSVTAHYLDNTYIMRSYLLDCFSFSDRHTAKNLCQSLQAKIVEWKIQNIVVAVVSDNAANISAAIRMGGWKHIRCFAHSVNLIVQSGLKDIKNTVLKVKSIVEYFKSSSSALTKLKEIQQQMGLPELKLKQDVVIRWNSTHDMLNRFLTLKEAIISTVAILGTDLEMLTPEDWKIVDLAIKILEIFYNVTVEMSSETQVTLSKVIVLTKIMIKHVNKRINEDTGLPAQIILLLDTLKQQLSDRFQNIESNPLYAEATILDPRFKGFAFREQEKFNIAVTTLRRRLANTATETVRGITTETTSVTMAETATQPVAATSASLWDDFDAELSQHLRPRNQMAAGIRELDKYLNDEMLPRNQDPLICVPKDAARRKKWVEIIRLLRKETDWVPSKSTVICSKHFRNQDILEPKSDCGRVHLSNEAIPMIVDEPHFEKPVELLIEENMDFDVMETDEEIDEITETPRKHKMRKIIHQTNN
ncbi:unnamed protein product [Parnassius apollo]|uniref:(apollo) hypothetical protein n=1 Tax=Parnassius apollo TaxID=110799 RepID=A0A8S3XEU4_PARAO|nr:unnamed protein product [Parnassius apollo]